MHKFVACAEDLFCEQAMKAMMRISTTRPQSGTEEQYTRPKNQLHGGRFAMGAVGFAASMCLLATGSAQAADSPTVVELQAEVARLQQQIQSLSRQDKDAPLVVAALSSVVNF